MLLAIDTATQLTSIALFDGLNLLAEDTWVSAGNHSTELAPAVQQLLARSAMPVDKLTGLAVCIGPGTYTGLRIGVSLAKGMASARDLPLVGLTTMEILTLGQPQDSGGLVTVVQAGRGRIITLPHQWRGGRWTARGEAQVMDWDTLIGSIDGPARITGEIDATGHEALNAAKERGVPVTIVSAAYRLRRAGFLAVEAWDQLQADRARFRPERIAPVYVQPKETP
jgi:tRNA threonylcarbamoyladenosine biosynthesis protein TsaB